MHKLYEGTTSDGVEVTFALFTAADGTVHTRGNKGIIILHNDKVVNNFNESIEYGKIHLENKHGIRNIKGNKILNLSFQDLLHLKVKFRINPWYTKHRILIIYDKDDKTSVFLIFY